MIHIQLNVLPYYQISIHALSLLSLCHSSYNQPKQQVMIVGIMYWVDLFCQLLKDLTIFFLFFMSF